MKDPYGIGAKLAEATAWVIGAAIIMGLIMLVF